MSSADCRGHVTWLQVDQGGSSARTCPCEEAKKATASREGHSRDQDEGMGEPACATLCAARVDDPCSSFGSHVECPVMAAIQNVCNESEGRLVQILPDRVTLAKLRSTLAAGTLKQRSSTGNFLQACHGAITYLGVDLEVA
mmetsp:Transcript_33033/g.77073  ORF Transcript_33033/g.77073 Transcript_33033/m.77073 type:complete len:141 (-) Transcript_33033:257-679(-)